MLGRRLEPRPKRRLAEFLPILAATSLAAAAACEDRRGGEVETYRGVAATVVAVERERRIVEVAHEDVPGLMEAMTMPLEVEDPSLLDAVRAGDRVDLTLRRIDGRVFVSAVEPRTDPSPGTSPAAPAGLLGGGS
jgi:Cu/Ag efflux protein CusF